MRIPARIIALGYTCCEEFRIPVWRFPGQPISFPEEEKGRFVPVNKENWYMEHAMPVPDDGHAGVKAQSHNSQ